MVLFGSYQRKFVTLAKGALVADRINLWYPFGMVRDALGVQGVASPNPAVPTRLREEGIGIRLQRRLGLISFLPVTVTCDL